MYKVIKTNTMGELQEMVGAYLEQHWKLCGGVCVVYNANNIVSYYQAMSK